MDHELTSVFSIRDMEIVVEAIPKRNRYVARSFCNGRVVFDETHLGGFLDIGTAIRYGKAGAESVLWALSKVDLETLVEIKSIMNNKEIQHDG